MEHRLAAILAADVVGYSRHGSTIIGLTHLSRFAWAGIVLGVMLALAGCAGGRSLDVWYRSLKLRRLDAALHGGTGTKRNYRYLAFRAQAQDE